MFGLSTKGIYGLTAVYELALRYDETPVQIRDIAEKHSIPQHYLEQILVVLRRNRVTVSYRGTQGGYRLARAPEEIAVREILESLEGPLQICPEEKKGGELDFFFSDLKQRISNVLDLSLAELVERKQKESFMYFI